MLKELLPHFADFNEALSAGKSLLIEQLWDAPKAVLACAAQASSGKQLLIITGGVRETRLYDDLSYFTSLPIVEFPSWEALPSEEIAPSADIVGQRTEILKELCDRSSPHIVLAPLQACLQRVISSGSLKRYWLELRVGEEHAFSDLIEQIAGMGYLRRPIAADKGEFAVRGGIIDIFPVGSPDPFRIEFFGDEIDSIRVYDPVGQKSIRQVDMAVITLANEKERLEQETQLVTLLDYLGPNTLVIFDDLAALEDRDVELRSLQEGASRLFMSLSQLLDEAEKLQKMFWTAHALEELGEVKGRARGKIAPVSFSMFDRELHALRWRHPFIEPAQAFFVEEEGQGDLLISLRQAHELGLNLHFVCSTESEEERLRKDLQERKVDFSQAHFQRGYLSSGFVLHAAHLALIPMTEVTRQYRVRRQKMRSTFHTLPTDFVELIPGDLVVHFQHGIGRYLGTVSQTNAQGIEAEFLSLEYADTGKLFVPIAQSYLVSKYIGSAEEHPSLHALGSGRWKTLRAKTERAIRDYAAELLEFYAQRTVAGGFTYPEDGEDLSCFEREFPYVETEDQLQAIASVKKDMMAPQSMDRLICGDVGYGKTEIAMRAAFKAVADGKKQVAILVPTTVLAMQHYENFSMRMANFPITVGLVSRFQSPKAVRTTIEGVEKGSVDILIGTHRLIGKDVKFKDLGLVIIDEEQRFGVRVKEKLRAFKHGVDCLTLSATPIPRTLYMSLVGARDMSVISTPPQDRLPIKTVICEVDDQKLKTALLRELARDGQAYFIHNRVETIYRWADRLSKLLPQARILVGHGQMSAEEIEEVFHAFKQGEADILLATTIVENGIDIPNANTILVDRADQFGLADLYQLRGRVGRWNRRAYCYFLVPPQRSLPELVRRRLSVLLEIGGYGGGMKVAMRDLELRGAGNILGMEQSGHISTIGFHLYCKMLKKTINALQGKRAVSIYETKLELPQDARLPVEYIAEPSLRMEIYQRLGEVSSCEDVDAIMEEVKDRFGPLPEQTEWLYRFARIRITAAAYHIQLLKLQAVSLVAERQVGEKLESRTLMISKAKDPEDFENKIVFALQKSFGKP